MFTAHVLTVSDKGYRGEREDTAGPTAADLLSKAGYTVTGITIVPDEPDQIEKAMIQLSDQEQIALLVTSGGTGFAKRDITPEITIRVCERMCPGIPEAMRAACLSITNRAMLSRGVAGIRGNTLIVNLPGSPKAVRENLEPVLPALEHGLKMLLGVSGDCAANARD